MKSPTPSPISDQVAVMAGEREAIIDLIESAIKDASRGADTYMAALIATDRILALSTAPTTGSAQESFPYQKTFDAIAAATSVCGGNIAVSVAKFVETFNAAPPANAPALSALRACMDAMLHNGVPTDPEHPAAIALAAAEAVLNGAHGNAPVASVLSDADIDALARKYFFSISYGIPQPDSWGEIHKLVRAALLAASMGGDKS